MGWLEKCLYQFLCPWNMPKPHKWIRNEEHNANKESCGQHSHEDDIRHQFTILFRFAPQDHSDKRSHQPCPKEYGSLLSTPKSGHTQEGRHRTTRNIVDIR